MDIEKVLKEHNHDGIDTSKINATSVEINAFGLKNIENSITINDAVKNIDNVLSKKQDNLYGQKGNIVIYGGGEIDPNLFAKKEHEHNYTEKENLEKDNIVSWNGNKLVDSGIKKELVSTKNDIDKVNISISNFLPSSNPRASILKQCLLLFPAKARRRQKDKFRLA